VVVCVCKIIMREFCESVFLLEIAVVKNVYVGVCLACSMDARVPYLCYRDMRLADTARPTERKSQQTTRRPAKYCPNRPRSRRTLSASNPLHQPSAVAPERRFRPPRAARALFLVSCAEQFAITFSPVSPVLSSDKGRGPVDTSQEVLCGSRSIGFRARRGARRRGWRKSRTPLKNTLWLTWHRYICCLPGIKVLRGVRLCGRILYDVCVAPQVEEVLRSAEPGQYVVYRANEALDIPTNDFAGVCVSFQTQVCLVPTASASEDGLMQSVQDVIP
jgi:hypothetical protein